MKSPNLLYVQYDNFKDFNINTRLKMIYSGGSSFTYLAEIKMFQHIAKTAHPKPRQLQTGSLKTVMWTDLNLGKYKFYSSFQKSRKDLLVFFTESHFKIMAWYGGMIMRIWPGNSSNFSSASQKTLLTLLHKTEGGPACDHITLNLNHKMEVIYKLLYS